ncbi:MAG TPA: SDR family oxidoreductase [Actinomycetes bacterium]|nr:SDR family oxidoreductase [Actinomycetes bacterium]
MAAGDQPVALVSGASRGIGREIARQLAADHGFGVLAGARDPDAAGDPDHDAIDWVQLDVADGASVERLAGQVESNPGHLDVLVNNAGIYGGPESVADFDLEVAHEVLETNVFGAWRLTQAMLPLLRESPHGRIVNVSSGAGQLSDMDGGRAAYRVSKAGLNVLTRVLAADERSILTNSMCPGWVRTDMGGSGASRSVEQGADTAVWLATLPDDGPRGGFFRDREPIPW